MNATIVSGANSRYFSLLSDLVRSIRDREESRGVALSILDLGLEEPERLWLEGCGAKVVRPGWDLEIPESRRPPEHVKGLTARPFLRDHFPGHDIYVWLDSDTWVQEWAAVELLMRAADSGALGVVAETDRAYPTVDEQLRIDRVLGIPYRVSSYNYRKFRDAYGDEVALRLAQQPIVNAGVFALRRDAPHWSIWGECYQRTLDRSRRDGADQVSLNRVCRAGHLSVELLPATCNWITSKALPRWDPVSGRLVEPYLPHAPIGILHLTGAAKDAELDLSSLDGGLIRRTLRYAGAERQND
ncbi:MAG: hypothetical protein ACT4PE_08245 [Candidatus Eiseniibacteriota bacterium]